MSGLGNTSRIVPRSLLAFVALHLLAGLYFVWALFAMRCVEPCPPGECYDGCSLFYDPWREGQAPYLLVLVLVFIASSLWLLRASRIARIVLLVSIIAVLYAFYLSAVYTAVARGSLPDAHPSWVISWKEGLSGLSPVAWLFPIFWAAVDSWFLFGSRPRAYFRRAA